MAQYVDGEITRIARNDIEYFETAYEIENYDIQKAFREGVIGRICELGYTGDICDITRIVNFVHDKFKEHNVEIKKKDEDCTRVDIKNWLSGKAPNDSEQSRPNVYRLCFALEMDAEQTKVFFLKNYLCRPFNLKKADEAIYYFCLNTGRNYSKAIELIDKVEKLPKELEHEEIETRLMEIPLSEILSEEDFLLYMYNHRYDKDEQHETVAKEIESLIDDCKRLSNVKSNDALLENLLGYNERNITVWDEKRGREKNFGISNSELPNVIKRNFPRPITFSQIKSRKATDDTYRKMLIILCFFKYYTSLKNAMLKNGVREKNLDLSDSFDEFEIVLDQILEKCGYVQVYWRNPFDRFILLCAKQTNPLEELKAILDINYVAIVDKMA